MGHSTRSLEEFIEILKTYNIELVVDVRRFLGSRKFPHFNMENLEAALPKVNIAYVHFPELGGYRKEGYLAFSQTEEFAEYGLKRRDVTRRIQRMNKKLMKELGQKIAEKRGHEWAPANFFTDAWEQNL